ncbi:MAG TPA: hypothetical protein VEP30_00905 [Chthoniobacterales bacterium]|nr:hypothetical protein [Chthoniobacterales bacterium]
MQAQNKKNKVKPATTTVEQQQVISCKGAKTRNWYAWINTMPPKPDDFHVTGEVRVGNPGVYALLTKKEPQGINPAILLLDLHLVQRPGIWPQVVSWVPARYDEITTESDYTEVNIFCGSDIIVQVPVDVVS